MSFIDDIIKFLGGPLQHVCNPSNVLPAPSCAPLSAFIVFGASIFLSLVSMSANRFLVDYKMIARSRNEYMTFMRALNKARKDGDEKQVDKLMRRQSAVMKMNFRGTIEQFKTYPITIVPFYLIYTVLIYALTSTVALTSGVTVAYAPFAFPLAAVTGNGMASTLSLFLWYLVCSFSISLPLSRIFGISSLFSVAPTTGDSK